MRPWSALLAICLLGIPALGTRTGGNSESTPGLERSISESENNSSRIQAPYIVPGEGLTLTENTFVVKLYNGYTPEEHFRKIGMNLSEIPSYHYFGALNSTSGPLYSVNIDENLIHDLIRYDPGVESVHREQYFIPQLGFAHALETENGSGESEFNGPSPARRWETEEGVSEAQEKDHPRYQAPYVILGGTLRSPPRGYLVRLRANYTPEEHFEKIHLNVSAIDPRTYYYYPPPANEYKTFANQSIMDGLIRSDPGVTEVEIMQDMDFSMGEYDIYNPTPAHGRTTEERVFASDDSVDQAESQEDSIHRRTFGTDDIASGPTATKTVDTKTLSVNEATLVVPAAAADMDMDMGYFEDHDMETDHEAVPVTSMTLPTATTSVRPSLTSSTAKSTRSGPSLCVGNQVQSSFCIAGKFPSATPYSGVKQPACNKADGDAGTLPRINITQASIAATEYCQFLVGNETVLSARQPGTLGYNASGLAENGMDMMLIVHFDVTACSTKQITSVLDFKALGQDQCYMNMFYQLSIVCAQDKDWAKFNPQFTLEGGIYGRDCGLWSLSAGSSKTYANLGYLRHGIEEPSVTSPVTSFSGTQPTTLQTSNPGTKKLITDW